MPLRPNTPSTQSVDSTAGAVQISAGSGARNVTMAISRLMKRPIAVSFTWSSTSASTASARNRTWPAKSIWNVSGASAWTSCVKLSMSANCSASGMSERSVVSSWIIAASRPGRAISAINGSVSAASSISAGMSASAASVSGIVETNAPASAS